MLTEEVTIPHGGLRTVRHEHERHKDRKSPSHTVGLELGI